MNTQTNTYRKGSLEARLIEALEACITNEGAVAERNHRYALQRLACITETAKAALAEIRKGGE